MTIAPKTWLSFSSSAGIHCFQSTSHSQLINTFSTGGKSTTKGAELANQHSYKQLKALSPYKHTHFTLHMFNSNCSQLDLVDYLEALLSLIQLVLGFIRESIKGLTT